jgi:uncharacterized caspase-like protein
LYFSSHGGLEERDRLYLAVKDTDHGLLSGTAVSASFIADEIDNSRSQRQVSILDYCHSGAFARGTKGCPGLTVGTATAFEGTGFGLSKPSLKPVGLCIRRLTSRRIPQT